MTITKGLPCGGTRALCSRISAGKAGGVVPGFLSSSVVKSTVVSKPGSNGRRSSISGLGVLGEVIGLEVVMGPIIRNQVAAGTIGSSGVGFSLWL